MRFFRPANASSPPGPQRVRKRGTHAGSGTHSDHHRGHKHPPSTPARPLTRPAQRRVTGKHAPAPTGTRSALVSSFSGGDRLYFEQERHAKACSTTGHGCSQCTCDVWSHAQDSHRSGASIEKRSPDHPSLAIGHISRCVVAAAATALSMQYQTRMHTTRPPRVCSAMGRPTPEDAHAAAAALDRGTPGGAGLLSPRTVIAAPLGRCWAR